MTAWKSTIFALALTAATAGAANAQTPVAVPGAGQTTTLTAIVHDQAQITVPTGITFDVTAPQSATISSAASVSLSSIVLASPTRQLKLSIRANTPGFLPPGPGCATWSASDVTWTAPAWEHGSGAAGTLSDSEFTTVALSDMDAASLSTSGLTFRLASRPAVTCAGNHVLTITWKIESTGG